MKKELISDILLWTPISEHTGVSLPVRTYVFQLCADTGCSLEDLLELTDDGDGERKRVNGLRDINTL